MVDLDDLFAEVEDVSQCCRVAERVARRGRVRRRILGKHVLEVRCGRWIERGNGNGGGRSRAGVGGVEGHAEGVREVAVQHPEPRKFTVWGAVRAVTSS